jgi:hypothetical protein
MDLFDIIPANYSLLQDAVIKLETVQNKASNKHPDVKGFVCITREWLQRVTTHLDDAEKAGETVAFINVALWDTSGQYNLTGKVSVQLDKGKWDVPAVPATNPQQSDWY